MGLAEEIFSIKDLTLEKIHIDEWDKDLWVRVMTGDARDAWEASEVKKSGGTKQVKKHGMEEKAFVGGRARLLVLTVCNEKGDLIFTESQAKNLSLKSASALSKLFDVATRINHISEEDIEDLEKNSSPDQKENSGSI